MTTLTLSLFKVDLIMINFGIIKNSYEWLSCYNKYCQG